MEMVFSHLKRAKATAKILLLSSLFLSLLVFDLTLVPMIPYNSVEVRQIQWDLHGHGFAYVLTEDFGWRSVALDIASPRLHLQRTSTRRQSALYLAKAHNGALTANLPMAAEGRIDFWEVTPLVAGDAVISTRVNQHGLWLTTQAEDSLIFPSERRLTSLSLSPDETGLAFAEWSEKSAAIHVLDLRSLEVVTVVDEEDGPSRNGRLPMWFQLAWSGEQTIFFSSLDTETVPPKPLLWKVERSGGRPRKTSLSTQAIHRFYNNRSFAFSSSEEIVPLVSTSAFRTSEDLIWQAYDAGKGRPGLRKAQDETDM